MKKINYNTITVFDDCYEANEWEKENDREWIPVGCIDTEIPYRWEGAQAKLELHADLNQYWCHGTVPGSTRDCIIKDWKVVVWKDKKVPYDPTRPNSKANVTDPYSWGTFDQADAARTQPHRNITGARIDGVFHQLF